MKKIGDYTIKGSFLSEDSATVPKRLQLFDGRFDTAYRIKSFTVSSNGTLQQDVQGVLATEEGITPITDWDFADQRQLAFSIWHFWDFNALSAQSLIDPENMVVEDLYLYCTQNYRVNYIIELEKYDISEWKGALTMVRNKSQA